MGEGDALNVGDGLADELESEALFAALGALDADLVVKMGLDALQQMTKVKVVVFGEHVGARHTVSERKSEWWEPKKNNKTSSGW